MRSVAVSILIALGGLGCTDRSPTRPSPPGSTPAPASTVISTYDATLTASSSCDTNLPEGTRERMYTAMLNSGGRLDWRGPQLQSPQGHTLISFAVLQGDQFSFNIDVERDVQSDDFHGLWEELGRGTSFNISGKGAGTIRDNSISGLLDGLFAFYDSTGPPPNTRVGHYCQANDHRFTFVAR